jgi:hypothetical protein
MATRPLIEHQISNKPGCFVESLLTCLNQHFHETRNVLRAFAPQHVSSISALEEEGQRHSDEKEHARQGVRRHHVRLSTAVKPVRHLPLSETCDKGESHGKTEGVWGGRGSEKMNSRIHTYS